MQGPFPTNGPLPTMLSAGPFPGMRALSRATDQAARQSPASNQSPPSPPGNSCVTPASKGARSCSTTPHTSRSLTVA